MQRLLKPREPIPILLSELSPAKLNLFPQLEAFVQTSCPRLSIDWGYAFKRPLLSPYEASVSVGLASAWSADPTDSTSERYAMDFYAECVFSKGRSSFLADFV